MARQYWSSMLLHPPDPPLTDGVVLLRPPEQRDIPAIVKACQDPEIPRWTRVPAPYTDADARWFVDAARDGWHGGTDASLVVCDAATGDVLGTIALHRIHDGGGEVGYWVERGARGRGVAARATTLLAHWALREAGLARVSLFAEPANVASLRVAEKAGFQREGVLRSWLELKGERRDFVSFSLLASDLEPR